VVQDNELVNSLSGISAIIVLFFIARRVERNRLYFFYAAFFAMLFAYITTILEGFFWHDIFNMIEHISLAIAGILFAIGCWFLGKPGEKDTDKQ